MDKQKAIEESKEAYEKALATIDEAEKVCKKIEPLLSPGWYSIFYVSRGQLEFTREGKADAIEFRVACDLVERALGIKLFRGIGQSIGPYLYAHEWIYPKATGVSLNVRVELNRPEGCKITYKRKWTKMPIVDEVCLGISQERRQDESKTTD